MSVVMTLMCYVCMLRMILFFKQKTAYEMRISDWSSDVCSSDLASTRRNAAQCGSQLHSQAFGNGEHVLVAATAEVHHQQIVLRQGRRQIGRASCRERVCQYV